MLPCLKLRSKLQRGITTMTVSISSRMLFIISLVLMTLAPAGAQELMKSSAKPPADPPETNVADRVRLLESELERQNSKLDQLQNTLLQQQQTIEARMENLTGEKTAADANA